MEGVTHGELRDVAVFDFAGPQPQMAIDAGWGHGGRDGVVIWMRITGRRRVCIAALGNAAVATDTASVSILRNACNKDGHIANRWEVWQTAAIQTQPDHVGALGASWRGIRSMWAGQMTRGSFPVVG